MMDSQQLRGENKYDQTEFGRLFKEIDDLVHSKWIPCVQYETEPGTWTTWKLPMLECNDASQVMAELENCQKENPNSTVRIIGFDNNRQVEGVSIVAYKPPGF